jgi:hypothetical protein
VCLTGTGLYLRAYALVKLGQEMFDSSVQSGLQAKRLFFADAADADHFVIFKMNRQDVPKNPGSKVMPLPMDK